MTDDARLGAPMNRRWLFRAAGVSVAAAGVNGDLQIALVDNAGGVWHTIRHSGAGTWDAAAQLTSSVVQGMPSSGVVEAAIAGS